MLVYLFSSSTLCFYFCLHCCVTVSPLLLHPTEYIKGFGLLIRFLPLLNFSILSSGNDSCPSSAKKTSRSSHFDPIQCLSLAQQKSTRTLVVCIRFCIFYIASLANNVSLVLGYDPLLSPQFLQSEIPGVSHSPLLGPFCPKRKNHTGENEARTGEKEKRSRM